jgi:mannose-6-phosphate isomerase-like protein (cupin superfamily)
VICDRPTEEVIMEVVNLEEKFERFSDYWNPKIVGELNGQFVKLVKLKGEFVWHQHEQEDELFLVVNGCLRIKLRDREVLINPGEFLIVPKGVEHCPMADEECHVVLLEPVSTLNTGNVRDDRSVDELQRI